MCYIDPDVTCDVWRETKRKARKEHRCSCCGRTIRPGEVYVTHFSVAEAEALSENCCADCDADRRTFANAHEGISFPPGQVEFALEECVEAEPEEEEKWGPVLKRIRDRRAAPRQREPPPHW